MIILKLLAILIVTVVLVIETMGSAKADDNIQKYVEFYNGLCNVQVSNNMSADLPHATMNVHFNKYNSARFSVHGISFVQQTGSINKVVELSMDSNQSVISLRYEF